ncbi:hypothetical protein [Chryseolinea sp. H1M3-3]|uniref:hypothetical protein n=1 Tax=Chryseolinea sp. H1M3-3 TaxID=3034144 RepID=UPI0023EB2880|nr:hypothetical protein [Chryseolinea sp. H1M3-3]
MTLCNRTWIIVVIVLITFVAKGQDKGLDSLRKKFDRFRIEFPQEKLYLHIDRDLYLTGENLWFKVYNVDGAIHHPMGISKVAYVEILDKDNKAVLQTKVALKSGEGAGALFLPASINSGNYQLRAYTQWMKNFSADYFFHKNISIVNSFRKLEIEKENISKPFTAQFFPEGGNLVNGLKSKVAFQAIGSHGKGINFSGILLNNTNDTIASFKPLKYGIGNFSFTPSENNTYRVLLTDTLGRTQTINLPAANALGYVLTVKDSTAESLSISIAARDLPPSACNIYLFVHARQVITKAIHTSLVNGSTTIFIPKSELSEGISHITLFDGNVRPQCERLYFKPSQKKLSVVAKTNQSEYGIRRKVTLEISNDKNDLEGDASLSVAVIKSDSLQQDITGHIFNYLWLTSDLNGNIESPAYYGNTGSPDVTKALDNLMLTHGWRKFAWNDVLSEKRRTPTFLPEYRGHLIRGTVQNTDGIAAQSIPVYLSTPGKNVQLYTARSKSNGQVQFEMKDFWGPKKIIVQTNTEEDSTFQIKIHSPYADEFGSNKLSQFSLPEALSKNLLRRSIAMQVQDVYYGESVNTKPMLVDSTAFYGKASETYYLDDYTRFPVMEEVMREYVPGVMVRKRKDGFHFLVLDNVRKSMFRDNPLVLLDGIPVFDLDKIMAFDPTRVKKLEVITHRYFLGPLNFPGIVSYTTYTGDLAGFELNPNTVALDYEGLQRERVFYSPEYQNQKQRESRLPDRRNLLYWNPSITLDKDGKHQLDFFTSDLTGDYTIVVEGLTNKGYSGSTTNSFVVKDFNN